jgi:hypothetical protein
MADAPLAPTEVAALLPAAVALLRAELAAVPERVLAWHPAPGEWCVNEVVGHIIEAEERGFAGRIREIIAGRELQTWDPEAVARERRDCDRDGMALIDELEEIREQSAELVERLTPDQLRLSGQHPDVGELRVGELRVIDLLHEWVHHDRAHVKQALSNVQARVWPHMGNAQRFSEID